MSRVKAFFPSRPKKRVFTLVLLAASLLSVWGCSSTSKILSEQEYYLAAKEAVRDEDYKEIRENFKDLENNYPASRHLTEARLAIAQSYYEEGDYDESIVEFQRFLDYHPNNKRTPEALLGLGMSYANQVDSYKIFSMDVHKVDQTFTKKTIKIFKRLQHRFPDTPEAEEAKEKVKKARLLLARHEKVIADFYHRTGAYTSAITRYRELVSLYPETEVVKESYNNMADSYWKLGNKTEAVEILKRLEMMYPDEDTSLEIKKKLAEL